MIDYLDAHQVARLECLKLASAVRPTLTLKQALEAADAMARFILDGTLPHAREGDAA